MSYSGTWSVHINKQQTSQTLQEISASQNTNTFCRTLNYYLFQSSVDWLKFHHKYEGIKSMKIYKMYIYFIQNPIRELPI